MVSKNAIIEGTALITAISAAAGAAAGTVALASGDTTGAPGMTKALARVGRAFGGSMLTGVAVIGASAALISLAVFQGLRMLED